MIFKDSYYKVTSISKAHTYYCYKLKDWMGSVEFRNISEADRQAYRDAFLFFTEGPGSLSFDYVSQDSL